MPYDLEEKVVIGISSRALFDLERENRIFEREGLDAYIDYQLEHEDEILGKGTGFPMVEAMLRANDEKKGKIIEVIVMSKNSPDTGLRIFNSIEHYNLDITRAALTGGESLATYLDAFGVDLFLSRSEDDVQEAIDSGVAAAHIYDPPKKYEPDTERVRIAFDADAVLFSDESEQIFQEKGLDEFLRHEKQKANKALPEGPFAKFLKALSALQKGVPQSDAPVRIGIVTARNSPAHERVIKTLREWGVRVDAAFFLGGVEKDDVLKAFRAHIFFDDQDRHVSSTSAVVPSGRVPYRSDSPLSARQTKVNADELKNAEAVKEKSE
jgi:5'-nucleotidase